MTDAGATATRDAWNQVSMIVLYSIILALVLQLITLTTKLLGGMVFPGPRIFIDIFGAITWTILVCFGIGLGTVILRSGIAVAGLLGAVFAPIGLVAAKIVQNSIGPLLGVADQGVTSAVIVLGLIKAVEYGFLAVMLAAMIKKGDHQLKRYVLLGLGTGVAFGAILVFASQQLAESAGASLSFAQLAGKGVNEMLFPVGCALVIYAVQVMSGHIGELKEQAGNA